MKKKLFLITKAPKALLIILFAISCNQTEEFNEADAFNCGDIKYSEGKAYFEDKLVTGGCIAYANGRDGLKIQWISFKKGMINGLQKGYYTEFESSLDVQPILYEGYIKNGEIHGSYNKYYRNGNIEIKGQHNKGLKEGKWLYYNQDGNIVREEVYNKTGKIKDSIIY